MIKLLLLLILISLQLASAYTVASEMKPEEVYYKVKEAYFFLSELKQSGITVFNDKNGQFSWKNSYVFILNCETQTFVAHPKTSAFRGISFEHFQDKKGLYFSKKACQNTNSTTGTWIEYWWQKSGEKRLKRRILYMITVPAIHLQVAASIYNVTHSIDELNKTDYPQ